MVELSGTDISQMLKGFSIPARPALLLELDQELKRPEPSLKVVGDLIARDVGVSAAVLKTLNSPLFGLRQKVGNVGQAAMLLGASNLKNIVTGVMLRQLSGGDHPNLERFWDSAEKVATISAFLCTVLPRTPKDEAYTLGLFRDCGIPIMMQRFPDYKETLAACAAYEGPMTDVEEQRHGTHHATVGYLVARSWGLSETVAQSILWHHRPSVFEDEGSVPALARTLVAVTLLAEHLHDTVLRLRDDARWERIGGRVLDYLGLREDEYQEIRDEVHERS
jgi:HD-like signal output (HDOD) protein